ncbi:hypothetical protein ACHAXR_002084 [Thalassiosira sp. AJA248-18]
MMVSKYAKLTPLLILCLEKIRPLTASSSSFPTPITTSAQTSSPAAPFSADAISNFLRNRCGSPDTNEDPIIWAYEGRLTDPMTGKVIAEVEGVELVKSLPMIKPSQLSNNDGDQSILGNLSAKNLLCSEKKTSSDPTWDAAMTVLSRRLFCYRLPSSNPNDANANSSARTEISSPYNSLLTSLRLRPDGPLRHLSPLENIAIYDSAITYISRNNGREMVVYSERGGRRDNADNEERDSTNHFVMGSAQSNTSSKGQSSSALFDFAIHAQKGTLNSKNESGGPMLPPLKLSSSNQMIGSEEVVISPPRSRFLQFGKGDGTGSSSERKHGSVRETYTYSFDHIAESRSSEARSNNLDLFERIKEQIGMKRPKEETSQSQPKCTVSYTRYGEAPPWYAPGRSCTLELRGKRMALPPSIDLPPLAIPSTVSQQLPSLAAWATSKCNFWSGWPTMFSSHNRNAENASLVRQYYQLPPRSEKELVQEAVGLFCSERQLSIGQLDDYPAAEHKQWLSSTENALSKMQSRIRRISKSFIVSELPRP